MANVYVSKTVSNGFGAGGISDSNTYVQAQSMATPWATVTKAIASATAGDTIIINDGIYTEAAFLNPGKANYTIVPFNANAVTLRTATTTDSRVYAVSNGGQGVSIGAIIFDGQNLQANCINTTGGSFPTSISIHGATFKNYTTSAVSVADCVNFTLDGNWSAISAPTVISGCAVQCGPTSTTSPSTYNISNGTVTLGTQGVTTAFGIRYVGSSSSTAMGTFNVSGVTLTTTLGANQTFRGITANNSGPCAATYTNNTVTITATGASNDIQGIAMTTQAGSAVVRLNSVTINLNTDAAQAFGYDITPSQNSRIENNTFVGTAAPTAVGLIGIVCFNIVGTAFPRLEIIENNITMPKGSGGFGGIGIQAGDNSAPTQRNSYGSIIVAKNTVDGGNHGILIGWVNNYVSIGNVIKNCVIGCVDKETNGGTAIPGLWTGNRVSLMDGTNGALYCKGSNGTTYDGNWVTLDVTGQNTMFIHCSQDPTTSVASTNCVYKNNILYGTGGAVISQAVIVGNDGSTATFSNNNYFSTGGFAAFAFVYQNTQYSNLAAWIAAKEANAVSKDPTVRTQVAVRSTVVR